VSKPNKLEISVVEDPEEKDLNTFFDILREYNRSQAGASNHKPLSIFVRNENGEIVGGLTGETYWDWLFVENLAVDQSVRKTGLGSQLLKAAEEEALKRGCHAAYLDTFSFQARPFYEKQGYKLFGQLDEFPPGHSRHFFWKKLS
jgi:GNAT superfamily N-acetyltransferase